MSRTIEAIMRHMAPPSSGLAHQSKRVEKLEKEMKKARKEMDRLQPEPDGMAVGA